jgi:inorganic pyrophosphatase
MADDFVNNFEVIIDRPKGTSHPRFKEAIYPVNYGYLKDTTSMDGEGIDIFSGTLQTNKVTGILCTIDVMKKDSEIKFLFNCTDNEKQLAYSFLNVTDFMKCLIIHRN